jgi:hypothetical protein
VINVIKPGSIEEKYINIKPKTQFHIIENHNIALAAGKALGLSVVNLGALDLAEKKPHLTLGLIWQVLKVNEFCTLLMIEVWLAVTNLF